MIDGILDIVVAILILIGSLLSLIAAIGINRLPDVYSRMHAASKAGALGSGLVLLALAVHADSAHTVTRGIAGFVFLILTAPLAAHLLAKAAYEVGYPIWKGSVRDEVAEHRKPGDGAA
jgi:multicomponent Na+:H+ antiporter subunit G